MNIFKVSEKERNKVIDELLNNITEEQLLKELISEGLEIQESIIIRDQYYIEENMQNEDTIFNIHIKSTSSKFIDSILRRKTKEISWEVAA